MIVTLRSARTTTKEILIMNFIFFGNIEILSKFYFEIFVFFFFNAYVAPSFQ